MNCLLSRAALPDLATIQFWLQELCREFDHFYFISVLQNCSGEVRVLSEKITVFISCPGRPCWVPRPPGGIILVRIRSYGPLAQPITTNQMTDRQQYGQYTGMERGRGRGSMSNVEPLHITSSLHQRDRGFIQSWLFTLCPVLIICKYVSPSSQASAVLTPGWGLAVVCLSYPGTATATSGQPGSTSTHQGWISTTQLFNPSTEKNIICLTAVLVLK